MKFATSDVKRLELIQSVFLFGESGTISLILNSYKDIYKLSTTGTLNLSDPQHPNTFWKTPLEFMVIGDYVITQVNYKWVITFNFINKH
ncbi:MAG: hypothetical protein QXV17_05020 [Candidatus Micrarchaeaceae archaeon]